MFDIELLNYNPDTPSFYVTLVTVLFAFFLSALIAITYEFTTRDINRKVHFVQSLAMIGVVAATVMQAIGDSLARGLGMLGALSIIRFRTVLDDPRNITFMFASLAAGIACGVLGFGIALTGTLVFCLAAVILRFSPLSNTHELTGELKMLVPKHDSMQKTVGKVLAKYCQRFEINQIRFLNPKKIKSVDEVGNQIQEEILRDDIQEFTYLVRLKRNATMIGLTKAVKEIEGLESLKLNFKKTSVNL